MIKENLYKLHMEICKSCKSYCMDMSMVGNYQHMKIDKNKHLLGKKCSFVMLLSK